MRRKAVMIMLALVMAFALTGCGVVIDMGTKINKKGAGRMTVSAGYTKDFIEGMAEFSETEISLDELKKFKYKGETYYGDKQTYKFSKPSKLEDILTAKDTMDKASSSASDSLFRYVHVSGDSFVGYLTTSGAKSATDTKDMEEQYNQDEDIDMDVYYDFSITFSQPVKRTNGTLSADKKTVTWDIEQLTSGKKLYAYTTKKRVVAKTNIKANKTYKKSVTIKKTSGKGTLYLDGKRINSGAKVKKAGSHKLVIVHQNGKKNTYKFKVKK